MSYMLISPEEFEDARQAFAEAWEAEDERLTAAHIERPGARTSTGLTAALKTLHIKVQP
jgi:dTDP-4-dehydrorhamnose 3,5-epimerase-like enzyme